MKTVKILIAGYDRQLNNSVEVAILDVCYEQAIAEFTRVANLTEFVRQGGSAGYDLIVVTPNLLFAPGIRREFPASIEDAISGMEEVRSRQNIPIFALNVFEWEEAAVCHAGADYVLGTSYSAETLKNHLRHALQIFDKPPVEAPHQWSLTTMFSRMFSRADGELVEN
jgi:hypothetical protein